MSGPAALMRETRLTVSDTYAWDASGGAIATAAGVTKRVAFTGFTLASQREKLDLGAAFGGMGGLSHRALNFRDNVIRVNPSLEGLWTLDELSYLLGWCLNGTPTGSGPITYPLGRPGVRRNIIFDTTYDVWNLTGCQVGKFVLSATAGGAVSSRVECSGVTFDKTTTFPVSPTGLTYSDRFLMGDQAITATGYTGAIQPRSLVLTVDHGINGERFDGSFTSLPANTNRLVTLELTLRAAQHAALWPLASAIGGVPMTLSFTTAGVTNSKSLAFTMPAVVAATPAPDVSDPELYSTFVGHCVVASGGAEDSELVAVLDMVDG